MIKFIKVHNSPKYYDNSESCAECTGSGCRQCAGKGVTRWPLSLVINGSKPPLIAQDINKHAKPLRYDPR